MRTPLENQLAARKQLEDSFERKALRKLENISAGISQIMERQDRVEAQRRLMERNSILDEREEFLKEFNLPVDGVFEAQELDRKIADDGQRRRFILYLSEQCSNQVKETTYRVMRIIFTNRAGAQFSMTGKSKSRNEPKEAFQIRCANILKAVKGILFLTANCWDLL